MSEPEISRRCLSCGATVRQVASFCPQCGEELGRRDSNQPAEGVVDQTSSDHKQASPSDPMMTQPLIRPELVDLGETQPLIPNTSRDTLVDLQAPPVGRPVEPVAKATEDQTLGRVEKIKKVSFVMIDQAAYDPSLRFVLVTAVLFVLFLILMLLSKVLG